MRSENGFCASSETELRVIIKEWGVNAPSRLDRTGKQKELERWALNRFLGRGRLLQAEHYPIQIVECERPDFLLRYGGIKIGIEITEICDEKEQSQLTEDDKRDRILKEEGKPPEIRYSGTNSEEKLLILGDAFQAVLRKKAKKLPGYSCESCILVCYLNSLLGGILIREGLIKIFRESAQRIDHKFTEVYVYKEDEVYRL